MQNLILNINGMTCGGCAKSVSKVLLSVNGVQSAEVDFAGARAAVVFDNKQTDIHALISAVEEAGFEASAA